MRHPALFYSSSAQFVPQMVNSLNRIGLSPSCSVENRRLAVELAALIIAWEHQRVSAVRLKAEAKASGKEEPAAAGVKRAAPGADDEAAAKCASIGSLLGCQADILQLDVMGLQEMH